jgi:GMP synthase-like glutamine amidotransferase
MKKILVFQHIERESPGFIIDYAKDRGIELELLSLWSEYEMPELSRYDALIVLGGPMGVYEEYPGKAEELHTITNAIGHMPVLGICLGAQLIAHALGARVYPHVVDGKHIKEIGYYDTALTDDGKKSPLFKGLPSEFKVLQWHGDTFDIPEGAVLLAISALCRNQAFSYGDSTYGLQFHSEASPQMVEAWTREDAAWVYKDFDFNEARTLEEARELSPTLKEYLYRLMDNFLS